MEWAEPRGVVLKRRSRGRREAGGAADEDRQRERERDVVEWKHKQKYFPLPGWVRWDPPSPRFSAFKGSHACLQLISNFFFKKNYVLVAEAAVSVQAVKWVGEVEHAPPPTPLGVSP